MVRTPTNEIAVIGAEFSTDVDAYLVADHATGQILAGKNIDTVRPLASLTKVMTGYRLLKEGLSVAKSTTYHTAEHQAKYHYFKIAEGEQILNQHLLYAMLISSLNTPTYMLASNVSQTPDEFVGRMNAQVREWGLTKTNFRW
jgi:D-alanyl-D-alanine carboxypeptidase